MTVLASKCSVVVVLVAGCGVTGVSGVCVCSLLVNCIVDVSIFNSVHFFVRIPDADLSGVGGWVCVVSF